MPGRDGLVQRADRADLSGLHGSRVCLLPVDCTKPRRCPGGCDVDRALIYLRQNGPTLNYSESPSLKAVITVGKFSHGNLPQGEPYAVVCVVDFSGSDRIDRRWLADAAGQRQQSGTHRRTTQARGRTQRPGGCQGRAGSLSLGLLPGGLGNLQPVLPLIGSTFRLAPAIQQRLVQPIDLDTQRTAHRQGVLGVGPPHRQ